MSIFEFDKEKEWRMFGEAERKYGYKQGKEEGREELIISLLNEKIISLSEAAKRLNISEEEMKEILN